MVICLDLMCYGMICCDIKFGGMSSVCCKLVWMGDDELCELKCECGFVDIFWVIKNLGMM